MDRIADVVIAATGWLAKALVFVAAVALVWLMLLLVGSVLLRELASPLNGTYEMVAMTGVIAAALALPDSQMAKSHVSIGILVDRFPRKVQLGVATVVAVISIVLFAQLAVSLVVYGMNQQMVGAVTESLRIPYWPSVLLLAAAVGAMVLAMVADVARIWKGVRTDEDLTDLGIW